MKKILNNKTFVISTHSLFVKNGEDIYSTGSVLNDYLKEKRVDFLIIKHPLLGGSFSVIQRYINEIENKKKLNYIHINFLPIKFIFEVIIDLIIVVNLIKERKKKVDVFIGINPLNAFYGIFLRKLGFVKTIIFYTADYAIYRFENRLVNKIYHWFDRFAIKNSDYVWNVSTKITNLRLKQGVNFKRNYYVPNTPEFHKVKRLGYSEINKHEIVIVSTISASIALKLIFNALKELSNKYPDISLKVIGIENWHDDFEEDLRKINILDKVIFLPSMNHDKLLNELSVSAVGLALYTNITNWTFFCDSMKARDYLACGLPVIITREPSTSKEIEDNEAGFVIDLNEENLINSLDKLFSNKSLYLKMRKNAINLAEKYDIKKILDDRLNDL